VSAEVTAPGPLLDEHGRLAAPGWARRPLWAYERARVRVPGPALLARLRLKEWDYWGVGTRDLFWAAVVAHAGYAGVAWCMLLDFRAGRTVVERVAATPLGRGAVLPCSGERGDASFRAAGVSLAFERVGAGEGAARRLRVRWRRFPWEEPLEADVAVAGGAGAGAIALATPVGAHGFYYNHKVCGLAASGKVRLGARTFALGEDAQATLDWGRGVWPYATFWNWATGAGRLADGRRFGLNLGGGFAAPGAATENVFFVDGRPTKLGAAHWRYDRADWRAPWSMQASADVRVGSGEGETREGAADVSFTPFHEVSKRVNLGVLRSELHQLFGTFAGKAVTGAGEHLAFDGVPGWAEEHRARW
jgi:hypothetical protein